MGVKKSLKESIKLGDRELTVETGRIAKQADGSVVIRYGDTMVLVAAVAAAYPRGWDLTVFDGRTAKALFSRKWSDSGVFSPDGKMFAVAPLYFRQCFRSFSRFISAAPLERCAPFPAEPGRSSRRAAQSQ